MTSIFDRLEAQGAAFASMLVPMREQVERQHLVPVPERRFLVFAECRNRVRVCAMLWTFECAWLDNGAGSG